MNKIKIKIPLVIFVSILIAFGFFIYFYSLKGTISVSSNPSGSNVYINDEFVGITPCKVKLAKGKYEIKISKEGFEEYTVTVNIKGYKKESVSVNLEKLQYLLLVSDNKNGKFYKASSDGKIVKQIGESFNGYVDSVSFFPDRKNVVFGVDSPDNKEFSVWMMGLDGKNRKNLTGNMRGYFHDCLPFPNGKSVLFISYPKQGFNSFWTVDIEGKNKRKITEVENKNEGLICKISPDGSKILFYGNGVMQGLVEPTPLWIMDSSGRNLKNLTEGMMGVVTFASFFPDGRRILFDFAGSGLTGLWIVDSDGKSIKRITSSGKIFSPEISKDGKKIFFRSSDCLYSINADGTDKKLITANVSEFHLFPDNKKIVFLDLKNNLWVINADGSGKRQITENLRNVKEQPNYLYLSFEWIGSPFSPDERKVGIKRLFIDELYIVNLYTGKIVKFNRFSQAGWLP